MCNNNKVQNFNTDVHLVNNNILVAVYRSDLQFVELYPLHSEYVIKTTGTGFSYF